MKQTRASRSGLLLAAVLGATFVLSAAPTASAGNDQGGGTGDDSFYAYVVDFSGDVSEQRKVSVAKPPPRCWWSPVAWADAENAEEVATNYVELGIERRHWQGLYPPEYRFVSPDAFEKAKEADATEPGVIWMGLTYIARDANGRWLDDQGLFDLGCTPQLNNYNGSPVAVSLHYYPVRERPEPVIDPEDLARYALAVMDIEEPTLSWNPRIASRNDATLVNLPTWVWVNDENSMRPLEVTASVGDVSVTVEARPDGLSVTSPAGSTTCTAKQARREWSPSVPDDAGCAVRFSRASGATYPDGFPVRASTTWNATYTVNGSGDPISLPSLPIGGETLIPVVQSQALVTEVG